MKTNQIKVGWSHVGTKKTANLVFRVGFNAFGKARHIDIVKGRRLW